MGREFERQISNCFSSLWWRSMKVQWTSWRFSFAPVLLSRFPMPCGWWRWWRGGWGWRGARGQSTWGRPSGVMYWRCSGVNWLIVLDVGIIQKIRDTLGGGSTFLFLKYNLYWGGKWNFLSQGKIRLQKRRGGRVGKAPKKCHVLFEWPLS